MIPFPQDQSNESLFQWARNLVRELTDGADGGGARQTAQTSASSDQPGNVKQHLGIVPPEGWLALEGQLLQVAEYPLLYRAVGRRWTLPEDLAETFRLPDGRGRTFIGRVGEEGYVGSSELVLNLANLPADVDIDITDPGHTHVFNGAPHNHPVNDPGHTHAALGAPLVGSGSVNVGGGATPVPVGAAGAIVVQNSTTNVTVQNATAGGANANSNTGISAKLNGGGEAIDLTPSAFTGIWIVKT